MTHLYPEMRDAAEAAIAAMQHAARHARILHARAELIRHMHATAAQPGANVDTVVREWLDAWGMTGWPGLLPQARQFTAAFLHYAASPTDAADAALRENLAALDRALTAAGTTLADQMAWRSRCAHAWWASITPDPNHDGAPFWTQGCPPDCV